MQHLEFLFNALQKKVCSEQAGETLLHVNVHGTKVAPAVARVDGTWLGVPGGEKGNWIPTGRTGGGGDMTGNTHGCPTKPYTKRERTYRLNCID